MPLYDYECECGKLVKDVYAPFEDKTIAGLCCEVFTAKRRVAIGSVSCFGGTFEDLHMDDRSVRHISSKEELARECHKAGVYSKQLMGSDKYERIMKEGH